jgi:hypothetical protein
VKDVTPSSASDPNTPIPESTVAQPPVVQDGENVQVSVKGCGVFPAHVVADVNVSDIVVTAGGHPLVTT